MLGRAFELCEQSHQCRSMLSEMIINRYRIDSNKKYMDDRFSRIDVIVKSYKMANDYNSYIVCKKSTIGALYVIVEDDDFVSIQSFAQKFYALMDDYIKYEQFLTEQIRIHFRDNEILKRSYWFCKKSGFTPTSFVIRNFLRNPN